MREPEYEELDIVRGKKHTVFKPEMDAIENMTKPGDSGVLVRM
jgi:hypothetical protein